MQVISSSFNNEIWSVIATKQMFFFTVVLRAFVLKIKNVTHISFYEERPMSKLEAIRSQIEIKLNILLWLLIIIKTKYRFITQCCKTPKLSDDLRRKKKTRLSLIWTIHMENTPWTYCVPLAR